MPLLGAHMSVAGGYYKAVDAAAALKMETVQIFTKNANQWKAKPLTDEEITLFRNAIRETGIQKPCSHASYLINLGSPKDDLFQKSIDALVIELERGEALGLLGVVFHPGSYVDSSEQAGLQRIVDGLDTVIERTSGQQVRIWLENTAGQGTNLGNRFEHLQFLLENVRDSFRVGVCIDTCHTFAAGYGLKSISDYAATIQMLDDCVGLHRVEAFHLNDSQKEQGSRVDRHEHIGQGKIGLEGFRHLLNDPRFAEHPMYLETAKGEDEQGYELDAVNLKRLRDLIA